MVLAREVRETLERFLDSPMAPTREDRQTWDIGLVDKKPLVTEEDLASASFDELRRFLDALLIDLARRLGSE